MNSYTFTVPGLLSLNDTTRVHWSVKRRMVKDWYDRVAIAALGYQIPRPAFTNAVVELCAYYRVKQRGKRKFDAGNIEKHTMDALVRCRILVDDSFPHLHETRLRARPGAEDQVVITIMPVDHTEDE